MTKSLEEIYSREWFEHDFAELQPEFDIVADAIHRQFGFGAMMPARYPRVLDVGCGPGMIVRRLRAQAVDATGFDGSSHALAYAHDSVRKYLACEDIRKLRYLQRAGLDLVICTEVAEHLDAADAPGLVALLCSAMCPIVFTAAPPGQDGHHHVNCQPAEYWFELFAQHGVTFDLESTTQLRSRWRGLKRLSHMPRNLMVMR